MKIIADENMPNAKKLFSHLGEVILVNGRYLNSEQIQDADVLLVRSVTKVTRSLLEGSKVKFVGSATIGVDHVDLNYLAENNIAFSSAPGCNAEAVADYVFSGLSHLHMTKGIPWLNQKIGIIGYGNVGQRVYERFHALGCEVCVYDPFKSSSHSDTNFATLNDILLCDVISLHAPLTEEGLYPTKNMIGEQELNQLKPNVTVISAGRGGIINEDALIQYCLQPKTKINLILDVWNEEPNINQTLVSLADIATPHIAGYSKQGREKGSLMIYQALCRYLMVEEASAEAKSSISSGWLESLDVKLKTSCKEEMLARSVQAIYDVARDDVRLRFKYRENKESNVFDWLRKNYVERDEFNTCLIGNNSDALELLSGIGFRNKNP